MKKSLLLCATAMIAFASVAATSRKSAVAVSRPVEVELGEATKIVAPSVKAADTRLSGVSMESKKEIRGEKKNFRKQAQSMSQNNGVLPTVEQARLQMIMAKAMADGSAISLSELYNASGIYALEGDKDPEAWQTQVVVLNQDTVLFNNLVFVADGFNAVTFGLIQADGSIVVPQQKVATVQGKLIVLAAENEAEEFINLVLTGDPKSMQTDAFYLEHLLVDPSTSKIAGYWNCYAFCEWAEPFDAPELPLKETYYGVGENFDGKARWETTFAYDKETVLHVSDLVYDEESYGSYDLVCAYDTVTKTLTVPAGQVLDSFVAESGDTMYYVFAAMTEENELVDFVMTADEQGSFSTNLYFGYAAFTSDGWNGKFFQLMFPGTVWTEEPTITGPEPALGTDNLVLNVTMSENFYGYSGVFGFAACNADLTFNNYTEKGTYDSLFWNMSILEEDSEGNSTVIDNETGVGESFTVRTGYNMEYSFPALTAVNEAGSTTKSFATSEKYPGFGIYMGVNIDSFFPKDPQGGSRLPMRASYANGWGSSGAVPGGSICKPNGVLNAYFYQGVPGNALYFTGIKIMGDGFSVTNETASITCRIRACHRNANGVLTLGDTLFTSKKSLSEVFVTTYADYGYGYLNFDSFYQIIEGFSITVNYMQINQEFCVELAWDSNDDFTFTPFAENNGDKFGMPNTYMLFGNGDMKYFVNNTNAWVAFSGAIYGYLATESEKEISFSAEGDSIDVVVYPMFCGDDEAGNASTALWLNDESDDVTCLWDEEEDQLESWVSAEIVDEYYGEEEEWHFTLRLKAEALPEGEAGRELNVKFEQWGAELALTLTQGNSTGIKTIKKSNGKIGSVRYDLVGRRTQAKGMVVSKDAKAVLR